MKCQLQTQGRPLDLSSGRQEPGRTCLDAGRRREPHVAPVLPAGQSSPVPGRFSLELRRQKWPGDVMRVDFHGGLWRGRLGELR